MFSTEQKNNKINSAFLSIRLTKCLIWSNDDSCVPPAQAQKLTRGGKATLAFTRALLLENVDSLPHIPQKSSNHFLITKFFHQKENEQEMKSL